MTTASAPSVDRDIAQCIGNTPLVRLRRMAAECEATVLAKMENMNPLGSVILPDLGDPLPGKTLWNGELPKGSSNYYASPTITAGRLYAAREDGVVFVASIDGKFEVVAENDLGDRIIASPVPVGCRLLLRGQKRLYCIGNGKP
jgi:hypothetical protein